VKPLDHLARRVLVRAALAASVAVSPFTALPASASTPSISITDRWVTEGATTAVNAVFTVRLSAAHDTRVTVVYTTANDSAVAPADFHHLAPSTLTFEPGQTARTIVVVVRADALDEAVERFAVRLSQPSGATIADATGIGIIIDSDPPPGVVASDRRVVEGSSGQRSVTFTATLSGPSGKTVTVPYTTTDGTAVSSEDYLARSGTLTFPPGVTSGTVSVPVNPDVRVEQEERFGLWLQPPTNASIGRTQAWPGKQWPLFQSAQSRLARVGSWTWVTDWSGDRVWRIHDNGTAAPVFNPVTDPFAIAGAADGSIAFSYADGIIRLSPSGQVRSFRVPGSQNAAIRAVVFGPDGAIWFTHRNVRGIGRVSPEGFVHYVPLPADASPAEGLTVGPDGALWFTEPFSRHVGRIATTRVITRHPLPAPFLQPLAITRGADGGLWFADPKAARVGRISPTGITRAFALPYPDSVPQRIAGAPDGTIWFSQTGRSSLGRIGLDGVVDEVPLLAGSARGHDLIGAPDGSIWVTQLFAPAVARLRAEATATIVDDDPALAIRDASVVEGDFRNATMVFQVALSAPARQAVRVDMATADGTAQAGEDYVAAAGTLEFAIGQRVREVRISVKADIDRERGNETFRVLLSNLRGASMADAEGIGTIVEDD
jgi:streptogramin lyase